MAAKACPAVAKARREVVRAGRLAGLTVETMALALGVSEPLIGYYLRRLGLLNVRPLLPSQPGEEWRDVPGFPAKISNLGRVVGAKGRLLTPMIPRSGGTAVVSLWAGHQVLHRSVARMLFEVWGIETEGRPRRPLPTAWTEAEDSTLGSCRTYAEAESRLNGRTPKAISRRAERLGLRLERTERRPRPSSGEVVRGSVPHLDPFYREARAIVPRGLQQADQDDLISEIVMLRLEGVETAAEALRLARRQFAARWKERSLDAPLPGTEGLRLIDVLAAEPAL